MHGNQQMIVTNSRVQSIIKVSGCGISGIALLEVAIKFRKATLSIGPTSLDFSFSLFSSVLLTIPSQFTKNSGESNHHSFKLNNNKFYDENNC